jgi:hypothetical protein
LDSNPPVVGITPSMESTSCAARASTSTTSVDVDVPKEFDESEDSELDDGLVGHAEDLISSSGDEFDD